MKRMADIKRYTTMQIWVKKGYRMHSYFNEMCTNSKNLYNTTNFYIRQVYTGLTQTKALQPLQIEVLEAIKKHLPHMNKTQLLAYEKKRSKEETKPLDQQKDIKCNLFTEPSNEKPYVNYHFLDGFFKAAVQPDYRSLPTQSSQGVMKTVFQNWKSFYASLREYKAHPGKFKSKPKIPGYSRGKEKEISFSNQDCVIKENRYVKFPKTKERLNIGKMGFSEGKLKQIRVIPKHGHYVVEMVFEIPSQVKMRESKNRIMGIDLGIDNLATIVTTTGRRPVLVKGKNIKSVNQRFNQLKAYYVGILRQGKHPREGSFTSQRLEKIHQKRFKQIKDLFHKASHQMIKIALEEDVDTIVIGQNKDWKQNLDLGKRNNQSFTTIPHSLLIKMMTYKAERHGIHVLLTEESYTSKASFLDNDLLPVFGQNDVKRSFSGKRMKRGLYRSKNGTLLNADVNGAANIIRKVFANSFIEPSSPAASFMQPQTFVLK
ncbi:RNA-guided endonuclease InsQ/TnpB family protein [Bacillus sp. SJS]|uniref:RNA-guided endonuclease InsQ/TnpB family protein n=1 Tax=Bacillus sp. SJS TaxID=1423321 RepID=UPI003FA4A100